MRAVLIVLFVGSCLIAPVAFTIAYVYCRMLLTFVRGAHPELYEHFGGHAIFRHSSHGISRNDNPAFFKFTIAREYEDYGGELERRCRTTMRLFWIFAGVFATAILSMLVMLPYAD